MPPEVAPFTLDSAVSLMGSAPATPATSSWSTMGDAPAPELPPEKKETPAAAEGDATTEQTAEGDTPAAIDPPAADAGTETPAGDDPPAATEGDGEQGSLPPIEAPSGWKADEKEVFKSLPRAAQEAIARREQDRTTELRNLQNATAEQRKAADGEVARLKGLADRIEASVTSQVNDLARDFPDIKTQADIEALAASEPGRFAQFQARLMRFNQAQQDQAAAQRELQAKAHQQQRETMKISHEALVKIFPTWTDPVVATKEITELQNYAIKIGASEQAARGLHDPLIYKLAQKAMLYDRAQAARAAAVTREVPRVVKPGTTSANPKADRAAANQAAALRKLDKSGDIEDALSLMRA